MAPWAIYGIISLISAAYSGYRQKRTGEVQAAHQKKVQDYNARVSENEATRLRNIGKEEELSQREKTEQLRSRQRAQIAANQVDLTGGSALALQEDTEMIGEVDALRIRRNYEDQARSREQQATLGRYQGDAGVALAGDAGQRTLLGSAISGSARAAGTYARNAQVDATDTTDASGSGALVSDKWYRPNSSASYSARAGMGA